MTSNVGSQHLVKMTADNRSAIERAVDAELRTTFRPEFLNRIDEIVFFNPLGKAQLDRIVMIQLGRFQQLLAERGLELELTDRAVALVAERGYDPVYGARPLKRSLQKHVIDPLAREILAGAFVAGDKIVADVLVGDGDPEGARLAFRKRVAVEGSAA